MAHGLFVRPCDHPVRDGVRRRQYLCQDSQRGEEPMSAPSAAHSVVEPSPWTKRISGAVIVCYALLSMVPLVWIVLTGFKTPTDSIAYPPKVLFEPSLEGYVNLFTTRSRQTPEYIASLPPATSWYDRLVRSQDMVIAGPSKYGQRYVNSIVI